MQTSLPVKGYTSQSNSKIEIVNLNKELEELVLRVVDEHRENADCDQRMVALANTKIQEAFMWLNRSVFKPERLAGPLTNIGEMAANEMRAESDDAQ